MAWLAGYRYRKQLTISGSAGAGTGYQVLLKIGESAGATGVDLHLEGHAANFPNDIRFTNIDGVTEYSYWVEKIEGVAPNRIAYVWIRINESLDSNVNLYVYYGNTSATSASNGDATFDFFDDFEGTSLDTNKWSVDSGITYSVTDSKLVVTGTANDTWNVVYGFRCVAPITFPDSFVLEAFDMYWNDGGSNSRIFKWAIVLTDGTTCVLGAYVTDSWVDFTGARIVCVNNIETLLTGKNTLPHSGTTNFIITKKADNSINIIWDETYSHSDVLSMTFNQLVILSIKSSSSYPYASTTSLDLIRLRKYADPEPTLSSAGSEEALIKLWNGTSWIIPTAIKRWDGSAWVDISAVRVWDGTIWQQRW